MTTTNTGTITPVPAPAPETGRARPPRLGFAGTGWIGRNRMKAVADSGAGTVGAIADPSPECARAAAEEAACDDLVDSFEALLERDDLDGIVIATPSALHADQAVAALERGFAVFCQKPLGRTAAETARVVDAARAADRLLGVDFSYRHTAAMRAIRERVRAGELGRVYGADLVFHNAYGPDKAWFYDPALSGGGCVMDLGIHLVDLALWVLDVPRVEAVSGRLFAGGEPLEGRRDCVEDYAVAELRLEGGAAVRIACSWKLPAGQDAVIEASFYGTGGGASMRNVGGSFYDFIAERFDGTRREMLVQPPDAWGGRAAVAWATRLGTSRSFDPGIASIVEVSRVLDAIYASGGSAA